MSDEARKGCKVGCAVIGGLILLITLIVIIASVTSDPVESARRGVKSAEDLLDRRLRTGGTVEEVIRATAHVVREKERLDEELLKWHRKELREAKEDLARARRDDDGSPESKRRIDEATEKEKTHALGVEKLSIKKKLLE